MNANLNLGSSSSRPARILVLDHDQDTASMVRPDDSSCRYEVRQLTHPQQTQTALQEFRPDVILMAADWCLPSSGVAETSGGGRCAASPSGIGERLKALWQSDRNVAVVVLVDEASSSVDVAIELFALGAGECVAKPIFVPALNARLASILESRQMLRTPSISYQSGAGKSGEFSTGPMVGRCEAMLAMYRAIGTAARRSAAVLISGEGGTGKTLAAWTVHRHSGRPCKNFQIIRGDEDKVDTLIAALDDASSQATFILEDANRLDPLIQGRLLDWIRMQPRAITSDHGSPPSALVMTVQTRPGQSDPISAGLRRDLFYELCGGRIDVPPLRERGGDIELLVEHFVSCLTQSQSIDGRGNPRIATAAVRMLCSYAWPGNVSELRSVLFASLQSGRGVIVANDFLRKATGLVRRPAMPPIAAHAGLASERSSDDALPLQALSEKPTPAALPYLQLRSPDYWTAAVQELVDRAAKEGAGLDDRAAEGHGVPARSGIPAQTAGGFSVHAETVEAVETGLIAAVLRQTGGNLTHSARLLGITRVSLRKKIHALGLVIPGRGVST